MGQYLAIGLTHEMIAAKSELNKGKISVAELRSEIERSLYYDLGVYDETADEKHITFTLKKSVLRSGLIPFLEAFYPMVYSKEESDGEGYMSVLEKLRTTPSEEWLELEGGYAYQEDRYSEKEYLHFMKDFRPSVQLTCRSIILSLSDGKIITEGFYSHMRFFKYCIRETFKDHPLGKTIRVFLTG